MNRYAVVEGFSNLVRDKKTNAILNTDKRAIEEARDVLPTPGGPTNNRILPFVFADNDETAINSKILSFISSIP